MKGTFDRLEDAINQNSKESFDYCMALINWFEQEKGWNPLYEAARSGRNEVVMLLIEHGAKQVRFILLLICRTLYIYGLYLLHRTML